MIRREGQIFSCHSAVWGIGFKEAIFMPTLSSMDIVDIAPMSLTEVFPLLNLIFHLQIAFSTAVDFHVQL